MKKIITSILCLLTFSVTQAQFVNYNPNNSAISGKLAWFVLRDANGVVYTSTASGLSRFDAVNNSWNTYNTSNSNIAANDCHGLAFDAAGNLWIATYGGGLSKFDGTSFTNYNTSNSNIPVNHLYHITFQAATNSIWIGTRYGGLSKLNITTNTFTNYGSSQGLYDNVIDDVDIDANGNVWIACRYNGVAKFDGTTFTYYTTTNGLAGNDIYSISVAPDGKIWAGATTGLSVFDGTSWINYNTSNSSLSGNYIRQIEFANGDTWIGSGGGGIQKFDGSTTWTTYMSANSNIANDSIWSICIDQSQTVWGASYGRGLLEMHSVTVHDDSTNARIAVFPPVVPIVTSVKNIDNEYNYLYSNIVHSELVIKPVNGLKVVLYDLSGNEIYSKSTNNNVFNLQQITNGIYIVKLYSNDALIQTAKILKVD